LKARKPEIQAKTAGAKGLRVVGSEVRDSRKYAVC